MKHDYSAVYRNTGTVPRRLNRVEDYYTIHSYKTEWHDFKEFTVGLFTVAFFLVLIALPFIQF